MARSLRAWPTALISATVFLSSYAVGACGIERWRVKILTDPDHTRIVKKSNQTTVHTLLTFPKPTASVLHAHETSRLPPEFHIATIHALLLGYRHEHDRDFHLVLADPQGPSETMIGELPDPGCVANATFAHGLTVMRQWLVTNFGTPGPATIRLPQPVPVLVRGVVFYDFIHGQDGVAPNGIEIHPILGIGPPH